MKNDNNLFFVCSLIEFIARQTHNRRNDVVEQLGIDVNQIYDYADVFHCEPMEKVADDFINQDHITDGGYDNISSCRYSVPDYWEIGEVFARLIEDCRGEKDVMEGLREVYRSWLTEEIMNFNSDLYYQPRDYLAECYRAGEILLG